jgi:hypothetical protein
MAPGQKTTLATRIWLVDLFMGVSIRGARRDAGSLRDYSGLLFPSATTYRVGRLLLPRGDRLGTLFESVGRTTSTVPAKKPGLERTGWFDDLLMAMLLRCEFEIVDSSIRPARCELKGWHDPLDVTRVAKGGDDERLATAPPSTPQAGRPPRRQPA